MRTRKFIVGLLVSALLLSGIGMVAAIYDASSPYSNYVEWTIASDTAFTVSVAAGETKCVFAPASKTETYVNATGQSDGTPIFTVTNAGNVNLDFKCNLTAAKPAWAVIMVNDTFGHVGADTFDTTLQTFNTSVAMGDSSPLYLWTNVTNAVAGTGADATHNRTIQIWSAAS